MKWQGINIEENKTSRKRVLGDSVYDIYLLEMSLEDFAKYVSSAGIITEILTETAVISVFCTFSGMDVPDLKWKKERRRQLNVVGCCRFDVSNLGSGWCYDGRSSNVLTVMTVNITVLFHGVPLLVTHMAANTK